MRADISHLRDCPLGFTFGVYHGDFQNRVFSTIKTRFSLGFSEMSEVTVTAKIKLLPDKAAQKSLLSSMEQYMLACNFISENIAENHSLSAQNVQKALYDIIRSDFGLTAQMTCSAIRTVVAKYKTIRTTLKNKAKSKKSCRKAKKPELWDFKPEFKQLQCDLLWNRDYSFLKGDERIFSISTISGRIKVPFQNNGVEHYFDKSRYTFGTGHLTQKRGKFYLLVSVKEQVEECKPEEVKQVVGIDRGIRFLAVSHDKNNRARFFSGAQIKQRRAKFKDLRRELQKKGTPSARKRIKAMGQRENRWMSDVNHCVTKALVEHYPAKTLFVLEDLSGIRGATEQVRRKDRYVQVSWAYYDFEQKMKYKAERKSCLVINVCPKYTSQRCPICGHVQKSNRNHKLHRFCCKNCSYRSNDDRIGAMNLHLMGQEWLKTPDIEPEEISIIRSKSPDYGAESRVPVKQNYSAYRCNATARPKGRAEKGRRSKDNKSKTVTDTTGQLQVIRQSSTTLRTP